MSSNLTDDKNQNEIELNNSIKENEEILIKKVPTKKDLQKITFNSLIEEFRVPSLSSFANYLAEIWKDLAKRSLDKKQGIDHITFIKYYNLPGLISERLFKVFDIDKNGYLDPKEFINGMIILFTESFDNLVKFIFNFYDFDHDGLISKEDVRMILSYVPLKISGKYSEYKLKYENNNFEDRIESQDELFNIIQSSFGEKEKLDENEFFSVIENKNSDILMFILMFLLEKRPFNNDTIKLFESISEKKKNRVSFDSTNNTPLSPPRKSTNETEIVSPSFHSKFMSPGLNRAKKNLRNNKKLIKDYTKNKSFNYGNKDKKNKLSDDDDNNKSKDEFINDEDNLCINLIEMNREDNNNEKKKKFPKRRDERKLLTGIFLDKIVMNDEKNKKIDKKEMFMKDLSNNNLNNLNINVNNNKKRMSFQEIKFKTYKNNSQNLLIKDNNNNNENNENNDNNDNNIYLNYEESNKSLNFSSSESFEEEVLEDETNLQKENSIKKSASRKFEDEEDVILNSISNKELTYEGYIYKIKKKKKSIKKNYFRLIFKDIYFFEDKDDLTPIDMHNLSGVFIKENEEIVYENTTYYSFSLILPTKSIKYYLDNYDEYITLISKLKNIINYTDINENYQFDKKIGTGKFADVYKAVHIHTKRIVAIKVMEKERMTIRDMELVKTEMDVLKICQHPNICKLYDILEDEDHIYLVIEYCSGKDLYAYIEKRGYKLPEKRVNDIIHKVCTALFYLHSYGIIHRDLKPENILMTDDTDNADVKLFDFGLSKILGPTDKCTEPFGTISYVAPEVLLENPYDKSADMWSLGVLTYLLLCGCLPFDDEFSEKEIARQTIDDPVPYYPKLWKKISKEAKNFVEMLLQKEPEKRMDIKQCLEHDWIQKYTVKGLKNYFIENKKQTSIFKLYATIEN